MESLTPRQTEILELIREILTETGMPPTRMEISEAFGFSSANAAEGHLRALARKGAIKLIPGASRGIQLIEESHAGLPIVGRVTAGSPILTQESIENYYDLAPDLFAPSADYLLRVQGMSMKNAGILDSDLLAVHSTPIARSGQIIVARIGDDVTIKRLKRNRQREVLLLPENADFEPIKIKSSDELKIEGIGVGILRNEKAL
jgi:repressor LexA